MKEKTWLVCIHPLSRSWWHWWPRALWWERPCFHLQCTAAWQLRTAFPALEFSQFLLYVPLLWGPQSAALLPSFQDSSYSVVTVGTLRSRVLVNILNTQRKQWLQIKSLSLFPTFLCQQSEGIYDFTLSCCFPASLFPGSPNPTWRQTNEAPQTQEEEDLQITGTATPCTVLMKGTCTDLSAYRYWYSHRYINIYTMAESYSHHRVLKETVIQYFFDQEG